jgi:hypothetical protein
MELDDFEVTDYESDLHDDFVMDELEVGNVVSRTSQLEGAGHWFELPNSSLLVLLVIFMGCLVVAGYILCLLLPKPLTKPSKEKRDVESEMAIRIRSVPIEEVEKVLYAGCLYIQDGCGSEIELLYAAQSRLEKEVNAYEHTTADTEADSGDDEKEDKEYTKGTMSIRKKKMESMHSLIKNIESNMTAVLNMLPQKNSVFNLQHKKEQISLMNSISRLNLVLEPVREKVETYLFSTLPYRATEYASELRRSVRKARETMSRLKEMIEGKQVLRPDSDIEVIEFSEQEISIAKIDFELALQTLVEGTVYLSTYDRAGKYEVLLREANSLSSSMYALQDHLEKLVLSARLERETNYMQDSLITDTEKTFLALKGPSQSSESILNSSSGGVEGGEEMQVTTSTTVEGGIDPNSMSLIFSNYMLASQGRRKDLEDGAIKRQEERAQRRLDVTVSARHAAEARYNTDIEAEVDKKIKLAGLSLQRSTLKVADKGWAEARKRELEEAYEESLYSRRRQDLWLFSGALLLMTAGFCITAFKCDVARGLRRILEQAMWQFCNLLSRQSCEVEGGGAVETTANPGFENSASSLIHQVSSQFYGTLSMALREGGSRVLLLSGLDVGSWALPDTVLCITQGDTPYGHAVPGLQRCSGMRCQGTACSGYSLDWRLPVLCWGSAFPRRVGTFWPLRVTVVHSLLRNGDSSHL